MLGGTNNQWTRVVDRCDNSGLNHIGFLIQHVRGKYPNGNDCRAGSYDSSRTRHFWSAFHRGPLNRATINKFWPRRKNLHEKWSIRPNWIDRELEGGVNSFPPRSVTITTSSKEILFSISFIWMVSTRSVSTNAPDWSSWCLKGGGGGFSHSSIGGRPWILLDQQGG
jgi:hypothetical protein